MCAAVASVQASAGRPAAAAAWQRRHPPPAPPAVAPGRRQGQRRQRQRPLVVSQAASVELDLDATASIDIESIGYEDGCYTVQGCLVSPAPPEVVYRVLTDYEALPRVFHNVESSGVRVDPGSGAKQLVQTCKWAFLVFSGTFVTELNVAEEPAQRRLAFSLIQSAFMKEFVGSWEVQPGADGLTEIRHRLSVRPSLAPPQKIGDLTKKVFKKQVEGILEDLAVELDRLC